VVPNLYPVVVIGLVAAFGFAVWSGLKYAPPFASEASWLALVGAVAAYALELRKDPVLASRLVLILALFWAIFGGGGAVAGLTPFLSPILAATMFAVPALIAIAWTVWMQWGRERFPNPIRSEFGTRAGEERGVQMAVAAPDAIRTGEVGRLDVYLQNAWDSPRAAVIRVDVMGYARSRVPPAIEVALDPLVAVVVSVPFVVEEAESPWIDVTATLAVSGAGGRRRRLWQAPRRAGRLRHARTNAEAAAMARGTAGGIPSRVAISGPPAHSPALPPALTRTIWSVPERPAGMVRG
jgi:hypothetical protein